MEGASVFRKDPDGYNSWPKVEGATLYQGPHTQLFLSDGRWPIPRLQERCLSPAALDKELVGASGQEEHSPSRARSPGQLARFSHCDSGPVTSALWSLKHGLAAMPDSYAHDCIQDARDAFPLLMPDSHLHWAPVLSIESTQTPRSSPPGNR